MELKLTEENARMKNVTVSDSSLRHSACLISQASEVFNFKATIVLAS